MTHVTCRLTAKNRDQLRNPTLGNRARATLLYPQNGDRIVTTDSVTSLRPVYIMSDMREKVEKPGNVWRA